MSNNDSTNPNQAWKFSQCFGDKGDIENITEADVISAVEFDHTGNYLATGDKGGRVVLFERNETKKGCEYRFHTEFQSHDAEFDYLKSLEIEEKINQIEWCKRQNQAHFLLSTNDKTIKLWKIYGKTLKVVAENNLSDNNNTGTLGAAGINNHLLNLNTNNTASSTLTTTSTSLHSTTFPSSLININSLRLPRMTLHDTIIAAMPRRIYANAHTYHINSISVNSDNETYISADDLRINLWNLGISDQSFNIVDIKPANMEELTEVITSARFHPISCNLFMYSTSKGSIKLADMRENALCDNHAKVYEQWNGNAEQSFFTEITSSIANVRFSYDGRYIVARDYMTVKIWDVNMEREPIKSINIHEHIRERLCDAYENDAIFDKFEVVFSGDSKSVMTGSYNNTIMIYPDAVNTTDEETQVVLQADKSAFKAKKVGVPMPIGTNPNSSNYLNKNGRPGTPGRSGGGINMMKRDIEHEPVDLKKNIQHLSWHPKENSIAIAATNNVSFCSFLRRPGSARTRCSASRSFITNVLCSCSCSRLCNVSLHTYACIYYNFLVP